MLNTICPSIEDVLTATYNSQFSVLHVEFLSAIYVNRILAPYNVYNHYDMCIYASHRLQRSSTHQPLSVIEYIDQL